MPISSEFVGKTGADLRSGTPYVMFVGRLIPYKNLRGFLRAIDYAREQDASFHAVVVGSGPESTLLDQRADVIHLTSLPPDELADWFRKVSILVHPAEREGYGMVMAEAMACGVVPIALRSGGGRDIIQDNETGFLVDSIEQIGPCLFRLLADPSGSGFLRVAQRLRDGVGIADPESVADSFLDLYQPGK
jgi:glycosyltransferase involved in cell wall biosynthesis